MKKATFVKNPKKKTEEKEGNFIKEANEFNRLGLQPSWYIYIYILKRVFPLTFSLPPKRTKKKKNELE